MTTHYTHFSGLTLRIITLIAFVSFLFTNASVSRSESNPNTGKPTDNKKTSASKPITDRPKQDQDGPLAGHSYHGEAFNDGPRQAAYLMNSTGNVQFNVNTQSPQAQAFINQGIGQLHGFWYFEAERSFRQAAVIDPKLAAAYLGMALSNGSNKKRARGFIAKAIKFKKTANERTQLWIEAYGKYIASDDRKTRKKRTQAYINALEAIIKKFPNDIEMKAFYAVSRWAANRRGVKIKDYNKVDAVIKQVLAKNPDHPVHHYRIHLWDYKKPANALPSAARSGQSAPGIAHMWHMSGHIYSRLKRYHDAVWQQEASARVDHAHMMRDRVLPDQIHNFAHNNEWLCRNLMNIGRVSDAIDLAKNMIEMPRHPRYNTLKKRGSANYGRTRLFEVLDRYEMWDEALNLCQDPAYLEPTEDVSQQIKRLRLLGAAAFRANKPVIADKTFAELNDRLNKEKKKKNNTSNIRRITQAIAFLSAHKRIALGQFDQAEKHFAKAGSVDKQQRALAKLAAGQTDKALADLKAEIGRRAKTVRPLANYAYALQIAKKPKEAKVQFEALRKLSSDLDLSSPVFKRLAPLAKSLNLPTDWRLKRQPSKDVGIRPDITTLGPFRYRPSKAPDFKLVNDLGERTTLSSYKGKPVLVVFYLGFGCLHCVDQLNQFAPLVKEYEAAGITIIAVSTDDVDGIKDSSDEYKDGERFPFTLLSNQFLDVFKKYRAYDDFEKQPLHGTFLIDKNGYIRWQDISYEPFMQGKFLLKEARRLLAQPDNVVHPKNKP